MFLLSYVDADKLLPVIVTSILDVCASDVVRNYDLISHQIRNVARVILDPSPPQAFTSVK